MSERSVQVPPAGDREIIIERCAPREGGAERSEGSA